jgi:hypothetical protein
MKKILIMALLCTSAIYAEELKESDKIYIDSDELSEDQEAFRIHLGHNVWMETNAIHKDCLGTFTYQCNVLQTNSQYEQKWKCPYCYHFWPMGSSCKNPNCPSKFKGI